MKSVVVLRLTVGTSLVVAIYQSLTFHLGYETSPNFEKAWSYVFAGLLAFWVDADSKNRSEIYRPSFDIGLFMYLVWLVYLPYYLLRTRGRMGWMWIIGLLLLASLGALIRLALYQAT